MSIYKDYNNLLAGCWSWFKKWEQLPGFCLDISNMLSCQIMDRTNPPTKTQTVLQHISVVPNTYYDRMEPKKYVYRPNINLVLAITPNIL
jgi:hypothetical protein